MSNRSVELLSSVSHNLRGNYDFKCCVYWIKLYYIGRLHGIERSIERQFHKKSEVLLQFALQAEVRCSTDLPGIFLLETSEVRPAVTFRFTFDLGDGVDGQVDVWGVPNAEREEVAFPFLSLDVRLEVVLKNQQSDSVIRFKFVLINGICLVQIPSTNVLQ